MNCHRCGKDGPADVCTCTPLAVKLADALQAGADDPMWSHHCEIGKRTASFSATELRRLSTQVDEDEVLLRQALDALEKYRLMMLAEAGCSWDEGEATIAALRERLKERA
jgi:hypothetical protein